MRLLLEKIVEYGLSDHIRNLVEDAQRHLGYRSPYRGGRTLTDLLRQAHTGARAEDDQDTAERLEDALSYATHAMLAPDLEIKYQLLGGARGRHANALTTFGSLFAALVADKARTFLDDHPQANRDDLACLQQPPVQGRSGHLSAGGEAGRSGFAADGMSGRSAQTPDGR
ncbi:hypothetical protein [Micromonospora echinospora]|uniref:hypothetical protein n=1 Tax=Micromonospora echinospora TaxID=1877 RepID=UPI003672CCBF